MDDDLAIDAAATETPEKVDAPQSVADAALAAMDMAPEGGDKVEPAKEASTSATAAANSAVEAATSATADATKQPEKKPEDAKALTDEDLQRPENLSHKARDRFEKLVGGYKAEQARAEEFRTKYEAAQESIKALQDLGFSDEASGNDLIEFAKFRHDLAANPQRALQTLHNAMRQIELQHGIRSDAPSALDQFPDLVELVNGEKMGYQHALEVARARQAQAAQQQQNQRYEQRQRETFDSQRAIQGAISRVEQMESQWRSSNPDYAAIHPHIQAEMQVIAQQFPPAMWPQQVELLYKSISRAMASQARPQAGQPTPLRGNGHAASRPAPKSAAEAALQALGMDA